METYFQWVITLLKLSNAFFGIQSERLSLNGIMARQRFVNKRTFFISRNFVNEWRKPFISTHYLNVSHERTITRFFNLPLMNGLNKVLKCPAVQWKIYFWKMSFFLLLQWIPDIWIHSKSFYNVVFSTYLGSNDAEKQV